MYCVFVYGPHYKTAVSNKLKMLLLVAASYVIVQVLSRVQLSATQCTAAHQASPSIKVGKAASPAPGAYSDSCPSSR